MKKTVGLIVILIIMLVTLTGCAEINYEVEVHNDGSGNITYIYGISKERMENSTDIVEQFVGTMREQAEESGYTVEIYEDGEISGFKANKYIENLSEDFSLEETFGSEYVKDTENNKIKIEKSFWTTKYSQNTEIDLTNLSDEDLEMTYKIKLPTKVKTSNTNNISEDGKELTWTLTGGEKNKIEFTAEEFNMLPIVIVLLVIIVIAIGITVFIILKKKHVTKTEK